MNIIEYLQKNYYHNFISSCNLAFMVSTGRIEVKGKSINKFYIVKPGDIIILKELDKTLKVK